ncbi:DUF2459 domain-containing protein [Kaarinaea lacus]
MSDGINKVIFILLSLVLAACSSPPKGLFPPGQNEPVKSIYLVSHGWHAGIVIKRADIPDGLWPEHNDFPDARYLEVGWGDKDYYMTSDPHLGITLKAGLFPTESVLHIVGFSEPVKEYFARSEIIRIDLTHEGFARLCDYLRNSYARDDRGVAQALGPGLYGKSQFYLSGETYHAFNTCNVWTARALQNAGCPITPATTLTVEELMAEVAEFGKVIQAK